MDRNNSNGDAPKSSVLSTDSLLSTNTAASTINPLSNVGRPSKDYSAALSILQSRYGAGGQVVPTPKSEPSDKIKRLNAVQGTTSQRGSSQLTLVSTQSVPNSRSSEGTAASGSSSTVNASSNSQSEKPGKKKGIASLFKGKGKDRKK